MSSADTCPQGKAILKKTSLLSVRSSEANLYLVSVMVNAGLLILYTIVTCASFEPWWIGFTVGFWVAIGQLTIVVFIKYYHSYYQLTFMVFFSLLLATILFIVWVVILAIYLFA